MKMRDLTQDLGIGRKFKHAEAIAERGRAARERYRQKKLEKQKRHLGLVEAESASPAGTPAEGEGEGEGGDDARDSALARARNLGEAATSAEAQDSAVGYDVVDGQIVINQQSLVVDRHAARREDISNLEEVEEDEFSHLITSSSFRRPNRRTGPNHWTNLETEEFYRLLGMFGTDFETIAAMFPGKNRRAVKLKFNREETLRPNRINATVMVRGQKKVHIDLEAYKAHQQGWQASDKILAEHAKLAHEHSEDIRRAKEARRAAGLLDDEEGDAQADGAGEQVNGGDGGGENGEGEEDQGGRADAEEYEGGEDVLAENEVEIPL